jgi:hypothetical protein
MKVLAVVKLQSAASGVSRNEIAARSIIVSRLDAVIRVGFTSQYSCVFRYAATVVSCWVVVFL